jgi:hypothetical protein
LLCSPLEHQRAHARPSLRSTTLGQFVDFFNGIGAKRTLADRGLPDLGMSSLSLYVTLDLMHQWRCARLRNLDGAG